MASSFDRPLKSLRSIASVAALCAALGAATTAGADASTPGARAPRSRTCCAFASHLPLHLGSAHMPVSLALMTSARSVGHHSYAGWSHLHEGNGLVYTLKGGFIDLGHVRDYADLTAYLAVHLRPLLARGSGEVCLEPLDAVRCVVATRRVPPPLLDAASVEVAQRAAFELSIWAEIAQYYGRGKMRGAEEIYSAFTPDDLYSNLLGTYLGGRAVASALPYDDAIDAELAAAFARLGAVSAAAGRRTMDALGGRWWSPGIPWPSAKIALAHSFDIGPSVHPVLAPPDVAPPAGGSAAPEPIALVVPATDPAGAPLTDYYRLELQLRRDDLPRFPATETASVLAATDLPRLVDGVRTAMAAAGPGQPDPVGARARWSSSPLTHYLNGLRLLDLAAVGGLATTAPALGTSGVFGTSLTSVVGDTRDGDFGLARFDLQRTSERGFVGGFSLLRSDALYFCRDPETGVHRPPLVSLLGPCADGEWLGIGGSIGEAFHDGGTGRTALRPLGAYAAFNALGNGESPSYDRVRVLLRAGAAVEHVWTEAAGGTTLPRLATGVVLVARAGEGRVEARGTAEYRVDPANPADAALQSSAILRCNFLLGGETTGGPVDGLDPWGVASVGLVGGYSYWSRPQHSFPDVDAPFVSDQHTGTWQFLVTGRLGFENLAF